MRETMSLLTKHITWLFLLMIGSAAFADTADPVEADKMHARVFVEERFPSAVTCGKCHPNHYKQWSVSQHAYTLASPMFSTMNAVLIQVFNGTTGDFCIRCHTPVGMTLGEPKAAAFADRSPIAREGVTCIACHRMSEAYGKNNGRIAIDPGSINEPVKGPTGYSAEIQKLLESGEVTDQPGDDGRRIHGRAQKFFQMTTSAMCGTCHDVSSPPGFRLEEAFSQYKMSPAAKKGVRCQDCHMGKQHGKFTGDKLSNFEYGPAARIGSKWTRKRLLTNHMIVGPDYSIVHPAIFPHNPLAIREKNGKSGMATIDEWIQFDYKAGWGTDEFEDKVSDDHKFPKRWSSIDDRYDARDLVEANMKLLEQATAARLKLLQNGFSLGDIIVERADAKRVKFKIDVANATNGHPVPTGFDGERLVWLHVVVTDRDGKKVYESGDLDPNGDLRDLHSNYVHNHRLPLDKDLLSLQSRFLLRNERGGEREEVLPVNRSVTPLPFFRPARRASILTGQPPNGRKHRQSISPGGRRWGRYEFSGDELSQGAPYAISVELKAAMVPVNLVSAIAVMGFDYNMSPRDVADAVVAGHQVLWTKKRVIDLSVDR